MSREALVARIFRHLRCDDTKIIAVGLIVITDVSTAIHMYRVSRNVKADCGEFEGTVDESVKVCDVEPFTEEAKLVPCSIVVRSIGRAD